MEALLAAATLQHAVAQAAAAANSARLAADALGSAVAFAAAAECQLAAATLAFETLELPIESAEEIATAAAAKVAAPRKLPVWGASFPPPGLEDCRLRPAQLGSRAVAGDRSRHRAFGSDLALRTGWSAPYLVTNAGRDAGCMVHVSGLPPTWSQRFLQEWAVGALGLHGQTHLVRIQTNLELYEGKSQAMLTFRDRGFAEIAKSSLNGARILDGGFASASVYLASGYIVHVSGLPREQPQQALRDWADSVLDRVCADRPHGIQTDLGLWRENAKCCCASLNQPTLSERRTSSTARARSKPGPKRHSGCRRATMRGSLTLDSRRRRRAGGIAARGNVPPQTELPSGLSADRRRRTNSSRALFYIDNFCRPNAAFTLEAVQQLAICPARLSSLRRDSFAPFAHGAVRARLADHSRARASPFNAHLGFDSLPACLSSDMRSRHHGDCEP